MYVPNVHLLLGFTDYPMGGIYSLQLHALSSKFHKMEWSTFLFGCLPTSSISLRVGTSCVYVFIGSCLATKVFIGNLPAEGKVVGHHKVGQ